DLTPNLATVTPEANVLPKQPPPNPDGFVQLFNGKDLTGWKTHPEDPMEVTWDVVDGCISPSGPKAAHLFSERGDYADFIYRIEAKVADGGNRGQNFRAEF